MKLVYCLLLFCSPLILLSQNKVGINTILPNATLDIRGLSGNHGTLQMANFDQSHYLRFYSGTTLSTNPIMSWLDTDTLFLGSLDLMDNFTPYLKISNKSIGIHNTGQSIFIGKNTGLNDDLSDNKNVGIGTNSLKSNTSGYENVGIGFESLEQNVSGFGNTGIGFYALKNNGGWNNTGIGRNSLKENTTGKNNTAVGGYAMQNNIDGEVNIAFGLSSLRNNSGGNFNSGIGAYTLRDNHNGSDNVAIGSYALSTNINGSDNVSIGNNSLASDTSGHYNVAIGGNAGSSNIDGEKNTIVGYSAGGFGQHYSGNVFLGYYAGRWEENDNRLYIDNSETSNPLIYGEFDNDFLKINGDLEATDLEILGNINASGDVHFDGNTLFIDESLNRVGIGTNTLPKALTINGGLQVNGTTLYVEDLNGRVGIGNTSPARMLEVSGSVRFDGNTFNVDDINNRVGIGLSSPQKTLHVDGGLRIDNSTLNVDELNHRVGIGTTNPSKLLEVNGGARFDNLTLFIDESTDRIGIGTDTPLKTLHVNGDTKIDGTTFNVNSVTHRVGIGIEDPTRTLEVVGGMKIDNTTLNVDEINNRVGIGTSTPGQTLDVVGNARIDGSTFYVDSGNNRVGVGTVSPAFSLDVLGNTRIDGSTFFLNASLDRIGIGTTSPAQTLDVDGNASIDGSTFFVDNTNDRVGIGSLSPVYKLDVAGTLNLNTTLAMRVQGTEALWHDGSYFSWGYGGTYNYFKNSIRIGGNAGTPAATLEVVGGAQIDGTTFNVNHTNNRIGIGTTSPLTELHIKDTGGWAQTTIESQSGGDAVLQLTDNASSDQNHWTMRRDGSDAGKLQWRHLGTQRMTMTTGGNLGIGLTNPSYQLHLSTDSAGKPGTSSWTIASDARLKQNIIPYKGGLNEILRINPVSYQYNERSGYSTAQKYIGVLAQDLEKIAPEMVTTGQNGYLNVNNSDMTYMLINAVKEQQEIIENQERRIAQLEHLLLQVVSSQQAKNEK